VEIQKALGYSLRPTQVYRLEKFAPEQATNVLKVIAETEGLAFNQQFVLEVARDELAGPDGKVSPVDVQILAQMISREANEANRTFDKQAFQKLGGVDGLLGRSLKRSLDTILSKAEQERTLEVLLALTDLERNVRAGQFSLLQLQKLSGKIRGGPLEVVAAVQWLMEARLITPVEQEGNVAYELAHERLILALRQVANQELSAVNRANMLLDARVNEWLGSGKKPRYLFGLGELWLLRQQQGFLEWGSREAQKRELLERSWQRGRQNLGMLNAPIALGMIFGIWSHTSPGQIQWARWQLMDLDRLIDLEEDSRSSEDETFIAITLDAVGSGQWPMLMHYFGWEAPTSESMRDPLAKTIRMLNSVQDQQRMHQLLSQILIVTQTNRDASAKATVLCLLADKYIKLNDMENARKILPKAVEAVNSIKENDLKATALSELGAIYSRLNNTETAQQVLSEALEVAKSINDDSTKVTTLGKIGVVYDELNDGVNSQKVMLEALKAVKSIKNEGDNSIDAEALSEIITIAGKLNDGESARKVLSQALEVAKSSKKKYYKDSVFSEIIVTAGKLSDSGNAQQILTQTLQTIESREDRSSMVSDLIKIGSAYGKHNNSESARRVLLQVIEITQSIEDESDKTTNLLEVGAVYGELGDSANAQKILSQALEITQSIKEDYDRANTLQEIAIVYGKLGDSENTQKALSQAFEIAKSVKKESTKANTIRKIGMAYAELNDSENVQKVLSEALKVAQSTKDESTKVSILEDFIRFYHRPNSVRNAPGILHKMLEIAKSIEEKSKKAFVISKIAQLYIKLDDAEMAKQLLVYASVFAETSQSSGSSSEIAQAHAELGNWAEALRLGRFCNGSDKIAVLTSILRIHAEQENPEFKALRNKESDEDYAPEPAPPS
jgi:tetratricopeptide (TPR) repeat protein